jgi:hypothetical protein
MNTNANSLNLVNSGPHDDSQEGPISQFMNNHDVNGRNLISVNTKYDAPISPAAKPSQYPSLGLRKIAADAPRKITGLNSEAISYPPSRKR